MFLILLCLAVLLVRVENNVLNNKKLPNATESFETIVRYWYPDDTEFNVSCVSEGCPALNNFRLCHKEINITVLHGVLKTATSCMRNPICGIHMDMRPSPSVTFTTEDWLLGLEIDGICLLIPGEGFLSNVSHIEFVIPPDNHLINQLPLDITMVASNMRAYGTLKLELTLRQMLPSTLGPAMSVNFPKIGFDSEIEYVATMSFNHSLSGANLHVKFRNPTIKSLPIFCDINMPQGFPNVHSLITSMTQVIIENSSWAVRKSAFLTKYFQSVIDTVLDHC